MGTPLWKAICSAAEPVSLGLFDGTLSRGGRSTLAAHYLERSQAFWTVND
jgi:hypothetical protein